MKKLLVFIFAAALSVAAAWYRHGDSAHAMGLVSIKGGRAHHPVHLPSGRERYTLIVTGTIIPPYSGDARVVVEGEGDLPYSVHGSNPIIDLKPRRRPYLEKHTLTGLHPRDRFAVWVVMKPSEPMQDGAYAVAFYDAATERPVLKIPVIFGEVGGHHHES